MANRQSKVRRMSIDVPEKDHRKLKAMAAMRGTSMKVILLECVEMVIYSDNEPNALTKKILDEADQGENLNFYKDLNELRTRLDL